MRYRAGRWAQARGPSPKEEAATAVLALPIDVASAKIRAEGVNDEPEDLSTSHWAGVVPVRSVAGTPVPDPDLPRGTVLPDHVRDWLPGARRPVG